MALGDEFYNGGAVRDRRHLASTRSSPSSPRTSRRLLARGAVVFNLDDLANAETTWKKVVDHRARQRRGALRPRASSTSTRPTPDWDGVQREWSKVVELDPDSDARQDASRRTSTRSSWPR